MNTVNYKVLRPLVRLLYVSGDYRSMDAIHKVCVDRFGPTIPSVGTFRNWKKDAGGEWEQAREINISSANALLHAHDALLSETLKNVPEQRPSVENIRTCAEMIKLYKELDSIQKENDKFARDALFSKVDEAAVFIKLYEWLLDTMKIISPEIYREITKPDVMDKIRNEFKKMMQEQIA